MTAALRFLFLPTKYSVAADDPYMTDDLAGGLIARGHRVDVLHLDWDAPLGRDTLVLTGRFGEKVVSVAARALTRLGRMAFRASKFFLSSRDAVRALDRHFDLSDYDCVVAWTPALTVRAPLRRALAKGVPNTILFVWDFFPISHREAGLVPPGPVYAVAKRLEDSLYRRFTGFITLLPSNIDYLKRNYPVAPPQKFASTPVYASTRPLSLEPRDAVRTRLGLPLDRPIAIFGGQITEGRGIEQMLAAARIAEQSGSPLLFLFMGDGRLRPLVEAEAARSPNVRHIAPVPREQYLSVVGACDVGLVATIRQFTSFAFPTKTVDYLRAGIPIAAAVEDGSEYLDVLGHYGVSRGVPAGDAAALLATAEALATDPDIRRDISGAIARCLDEVLDLRHAVDTLLELIDAPSTRTLP